MPFTRKVTLELYSELGDACGVTINRIAGYSFLFKILHVVANKHCCCCCFPVSSTFSFWTSLKSRITFFLFFIMKIIKLYFFHFIGPTFLKAQLEIVLWHREIDTVAFCLSKIETNYY